jgi:hypothetical protein
LRGSYGPCRASSSDLNTVGGKGTLCKTKRETQRETHWEPKWQTLCSRTPAQVWESSRVEVLKSTMLESGTGCYSVISSVLKFEELYSHLSRYVCRILFCKAVAGHYAGFFSRRLAIHCSQPGHVPGTRITSGIRTPKLKLHCSHFGCLLEPHLKKMHPCSCRNSRTGRLTWQLKTSITPDI